MKEGMSIREIEEFADALMICARDNIAKRRKEGESRDEHMMRIGAGMGYLDIAIKARDRIEDMKCEGEEKCVGTVKKSVEELMKIIKESSKPVKNSVEEDLNEVRGKGLGGEQRKKFNFVRMNISEEDRDALEFIGMYDGRIYRLKMGTRMQKGMFEFICGRDDVNELYRYLRDKVCDEGIALIDSYDVTDIVIDEVGMFEMGVWEMIDRRVKERKAK